MCVRVRVHMYVCVYVYAYEEEIIIFWLKSKLLGTNFTKTIF